MNKEFYNDIKEILEQARKRIYRNIQSEMVLAYWQIGKMIVEKQGGSPRADYGEGLISELSIQMTKDYGKGFDATNLRKMRQFYMLFPNANALRSQFQWEAQYMMCNSLMKYHSKMPQSTIPQNFSQFPDVRKIVNAGE